MKQTLSPTNATARTRRITALLLTVLLLTASCTLLSVPASAASAVRVTVSGREVVAGKARIINGTTYVPLRAFITDLSDNSTVTWNAATRTAKATVHSVTVSATVGKAYLLKNGERISSTAQNRLIGGSLFVPVRPIATALGYTVSWEHSTYTAALTKKSTPAQGSGGASSGSSSGGTNTGGATGGGTNTSYSESDLYWLSRIIEAEAGGESYRGKLAVGTVVMNRVRSADYPNTIYGVIFDRRYGVQFTPAYNGAIYKTPSKDSIAAAKEVLGGYRLHNGILFFLNPSLASSAWFDRNLTYVFRIGNHVFYAP